MAFAPSAVYPSAKAEPSSRRITATSSSTTSTAKACSLSTLIASGSLRTPLTIQGWRYALVKKTVVYIVTDEADDGQPVVQKWSIKAHRIYSN
jgi:hypothetical protein